MKKFFDVVVLKEFISRQSGKEEKRVTWKKVGTAWPSQSGESLNIEMNMFPNQIYVVRIKPRDEKPEADSKPSEDAPF